METLTINQSYIKDNRLCAEILAEKPYEMWFEVEEEYKKYLCNEKEDAFLIAVLPYAIKHELNIVVEGCISSKLYYQLDKCLIPLLCKKFGKKKIQISSKLDNSTLVHENAVGTGVSCGVDSFYTMLKNTNLEEKEFNITHLTFFNAGASGRFGGEEARNLYNVRKEKARKFAEDNNCKFVCVDTNMNEFLMMSHIATHTFRSLACVLAIQKLFSKYYYASAGDDFDDTKISTESTAYYDILNVQCLSNENVQFYSDGVGVSRLEKIKEIVKYPVTYDWLNVCIDEDRNCGYCPKCKRTQLEVDSIGKISKYEKVFSLNYFYKNRNKFLADMLIQKQKNFYFKEIYNEYKNNNIKIPISVYFVALAKSIIMPLKRFIKKLIFRKRNDAKKIDEGWI